MQITRSDTTAADDRQLVEAVAQGDIPAYRELLTRYYPRCMHIAERMLGDVAEAEDVAQEICLRLWRKPQSWQQQAKFSTWLYRVVVNACIDRQRRRVTTATLEEEQLADPHQGAETRLMQQERGQQVRRMLQRLPERQRAAMILCYYEELSNQEAAEALEMTTGALQQLLFRAREKLKQMMDETL
jgi:RNA polymerase sigma-70 factor (ECF subfamily)